MKLKLVPGLMLVAAMLSPLAFADETPEHFVWTNSPDASAPYTNWATAAHSIQPALDEAGDGDTVWVTNGIYTLASQVTITNAIVLASVNGRDLTILDGGAPAATNRCLYITTNAVIDGVTITKGYVDPNSFGGPFGAGIYMNTNSGAIIRNCTIAGNAVYSPVAVAAAGGGVFVEGRGYIDNCIVFSNSVDTQIGGYENGGGIALSRVSTTGNGIVSNCVIFANVVTSSLAINIIHAGGGVYMDLGTVVANSEIFSNSVTSGNSGRGGGVFENGGVTRNCIIRHNISSAEGDGVFNNGAGVVENCLIYGNYGQGIRLNTPGLLRNSTVAANTEDGVATYKDCLVENVISYYNANKDVVCSTSVGGPTSYFTNCCSKTGQLLTNGVDNITDAPSFANTNAADYRLTLNSPCVNKGINRGWMDTAVDLDGHARIDRHYGNVVDMGAYEFVPSGMFFMAR